MNTWLELIMPHVVATGNILSFGHVDSFFAFTNVSKILISAQSTTLPLASLLL